MDARSMSMSSVGKVVYESMHRATAAGAACDVQPTLQQQPPPHQLPEAVANQRNNLVYCPSPYATTRVSLFFPTGVGGANRGESCHQSTSLTSEQNCYDMPILKPVSPACVL